MSSDCHTDTCLHAHSAYKTSYSRRTDKQLKLRGITLIQWNLAKQSPWNVATSLKQPVLQANGSLRSSHLTNPASFAGPKCGWNSKVPLYIQNTTLYRPISPSTWTIIIEHGTVIYYIWDAWFSAMHICCQGRKGGRGKWRGKEGEGGREGRGIYTQLPGYF